MARRITTFSYTKTTFLVITGLVLFRLWYATSIDLVGDEAQYWLWSQPFHLSMSYFSKGPGVAWTIAAGTWLFGESIIGIRFFAIMLAAGTSTWLFFLARKLFDSRTGFWCVIVSSLMPMYAVGSVLMTIDPLSVFFWTLAAYFLWKAKDTDRLWPWVWTGLLIGLGALCKYTNLFQILCFALFLLACPEYRRHFVRPTFWLMVITVLVCMTPVILWNMKYDWPTVTHLIHRGGLDQVTVGMDGVSRHNFRIRPGELFQFFGEQALVISPFIWIGILTAAFLALSTSPVPVVYRFLCALFLPLMVFYSILSLNENAEANWTAPAYIAGVLLGVSIWLQFWKKSVWWRAFAVLALAVGLFETSVMHVPPAMDWVTQKGLLKKNPMNRLRGWTSLAREVSAQQRKHGASFVIANKYTYASLLSFYMPNQPQTYLPSEVGLNNQFSFWPDYTDGFWGYSAIYVSDSPQIPIQLTREFQAVEVLETFITEDRGRPINTFYFFLCRDFGATQQVIPLPESLPVTSPKKPAKEKAQKKSPAKPNWKTKER